MKKVIAAAGIGAALITIPVVAAGTASAGFDSDAAFVACVAQDCLYNRNGPSHQAADGHEIANHIAMGIRNPLQERDWVNNNAPAAIGVTDANWLANCATQVYLGYGPGSSSNDNEGGYLA